MTTLAEDYLNGNNGSVQAYHNMLSRGQRIGQAFVNALCEHDYNRLVGTIHDPFHADGSPYEIQEKVYKAIEFLLDDRAHFVLRYKAASTYPDRTACGCSKGEDHYEEKAVSV